MATQNATQQTGGEFAALAGSALKDNVGRTPDRLVEEFREELRKIDEEFQYRDGIEAMVARQDAVLRLTLWAVGRLARMMSSADGKAPNAEVSDECPPLTQQTEKPRTGIRSLH